MLSTLVGVLLLLLGIVCYVVGLFVYFKTQIVAPPPDSKSTKNMDITALVEAIAKVLEQFAKVSVPVQWGLLGSLNIGISLYLLANKPF